jgi:hypothetical protein
MFNNESLSQVDKKLLNLIPVIKEGIYFETVEDGILVYEPYDGKGQNFLRKYMFFPIPKNKKMLLEGESAFVFKQIDGKKTVDQIGKKIEQHYGDEHEYVYERLFLFLTHLYEGRKWIYYDDRKL